MKGGEAAGEGEKGERSPPPPDRGCHHCQAPSLFLAGGERSRREERRRGFVRSFFFPTLSLSPTTRRDPSSSAEPLAVHSSPSPLPIAVVGSGLDEERRNAWRCYLAALPLRPPPASGGGGGEPPSPSSFPPPLRRPVPFLGSGYDRRERGGGGGGGSSRGRVERPPSDGRTDGQRRPRGGGGWRN